METNAGTRLKSTNWEFRSRAKYEHVYIPKFWLEYTSLRHDPDYLVLEFSVPKFLLGTSLYSVTMDHYEFLIDELHSFLQKIHVSTSKTTIENAIIVQVAFCKNIRLDDIATAAQAIAVFDRLNYIPRADTHRNSYQNESGYGIKFFNSAQSFGIYEKLPEIIHSAVTPEEVDIARQWKKNGVVSTKHQSPIREVLRFELTLQNKKAVNQTLCPILGKQADYSLKQTYSATIASTLLRRTMNQLANHPAREFIYAPDFTHPMLISAIRKYAPTRMYESEMLAIMRGIQEKGVQKYRQEFLDRMTLRTWQTRSAILRKISNEIDWEHIPQTSERDIVRYMMQQFGIEPKHIRATQLPLIKG